MCWSIRITDKKEYFVAQAWTAEFLRIIILELALKLARASQYDCLRV